MRHLVNFGLLFSFSALAATGTLAYFQPFSLSVTNIHIIAGFVTLVLVVLHIVARVPYFKNRMTKGRQRISARLQVVIIGIACGGLVYASINNQPPASWLIENSCNNSNRYSCCYIPKALCANSTHQTLQS